MSLSEVWLVEIKILCVCIQTSRAGTDWMVWFPGPPFDIKDHLDPIYFLEKIFFVAFLHGMCQFQPYSYFQSVIIILKICVDPDKKRLAEIPLAVVSHQIRDWQGFCEHLECNHCKQRREHDMYVNCACTVCMLNLNIMLPQNDIVLELQLTKTGALADKGLKVGIVMKAMLFHAYSSSISALVVSYASYWERRKKDYKTICFSISAYSKVCLSVSKYFCELLGLMLFLSGNGNLTMMP